MFLTHTQAADPTIGGTTAGAREAVDAQIKHLAAFIQASRDPAVPAMLFGDFNVDPFAHPDLYAYLLVQSLGRPADPAPVTDGWRTCGRPGPARPTMASSRPFTTTTPPAPPTTRAVWSDDRAPGLHLQFPRRPVLAAPERADVVIQQWEPGRDMSDHYGVQVAVDTTTQVLPADGPMGAVNVTLARFTCLQTTSGPGDDEVRFWLSAKGDRGQVTMAASEVDDVSAGTVHDFGLASLRLQDPGERLSLRVEGKEIDDLSADDSLGVGRLVFDRQELLALWNRAKQAAGPVTVTLPVLRGDGGEYVVDVRLGFDG